MTEFAKHIALLQRFAQESPPETFGGGEVDDRETFLELFRGGYITCSNPDQIVGVPGHDYYVMPRITTEGRQKLSEWRDLAWQHTPRGRCYALLKRGTLWIGILVGSGATKAVEWLVERFLSGINH